jgi:hypothetical protein
MGLNGTGGSRWGLMSLCDLAGPSWWTAPAVFGGQNGMSSSPSWLAGSAVTPASGSAAVGLGSVLDGDVVDLECEPLVAGAGGVLAGTEVAVECGFPYRVRCFGMARRLALSVACPAYLLGAMHLRRLPAGRRRRAIRSAARFLACSRTA